MSPVQLRYHEDKALLGSRRYGGGLLDIGRFEVQPRETVSKYLLTRL